MDLTNGFIALPSGFGTADELFEILTWAQPGLHAKPIRLLNVDGLLDPLLAWLDPIVQKACQQPKPRKILMISGVSAELSEMILHHKSAAPMPRGLF